MREAKSKRQAWLSGELAGLTGVSSDTLRHYERIGLLPKANRAANGYRHYPAACVQRVGLIRSALAIGFTLQELAGIMGIRDRGQAPCADVRALAAIKADELKLRIQDLRTLHRELRQTLRDWDRRLAAAGRGKRAGLLESFVTSHPERARTLSPLLSPGLNKKLQSKEASK